MRYKVTKIDPGTFHIQSLSFRMLAAVCRHQPSERTTEQEDKNIDVDCAGTDVRKETPQGQTATTTTT